MSPSWIGIAGIIIFLTVLFLLELPVGFAMAIVGFLGVWYMGSLKAGFGMLSTDLWTTFSSYGLTVIPLFILMGQVAFHSGINNRLYNTAYKWVGQIRGGIAVSTIVACAGFGCICGSPSATAATMTTVALPQMKKFEYESMLSTGAIACGATLAGIIPPSTVLMIIGLYTGQSIAKLFYGGFAAGALLTILLSLTVSLLCTFYPKWGPLGPKASFKEKIRAIPGSFEMVVLFLLVMLGLYIGIFTPTEAAAAGSFLAIIMSIVQRSLGWKGFIAAVADTLRISAMVIMIVAGALIFGRFLALTRLPYEIATWVTSVAVPGELVMAIIFVIYIVGGMVMDALALLLITIPIFFPVAEQLGYNLLWFSIVVTVLTALGAITPPIGIATYVVAGMADDIPQESIFKGVSFFVPAYIICIVLLMIFKDIATFLPNLLK